MYLLGSSPFIVSGTLSLYVMFFTAMSNPQAHLQLQAKTNLHPVAAYPEIVVHSFIQSSVDTDRKCLVDTSYHTHSWEFFRDFGGFIRPLFKDHWARASLSPYFEQVQMARMELSLPPAGLRILRATYLGSTPHGGEQFNLPRDDATVPTHLPYCLRGQVFVDITWEVFYPKDLLHQAMADAEVPDADIPTTTTSTNALSAPVPPVPQPPPAVDTNTSNATQPLNIPSAASTPLQDEASGSGIPTHLSQEIDSLNNMPPPLQGPSLQLERSSTPPLPHDPVHQLQGQEHDDKIRPKLNADMPILDEQPQLDTQQVPSPAVHAHLG